MSNWHWESSTQALDFGKLNQRMKALENAFNADLGDITARHSAMPVLNIKRFGASVNRGDNTSAILSAAQAADEQSGVVYVPPEGEFAFDGEIDLSDMFSVAFVGTGSQAHQASRLVYTGDGDCAFRLASAQGISFERLFLGYSNEDFEGSLFLTDHSASASDPANLHWDMCRLAGMGDAVSAASLVELTNTIFVTFRRTSFWNAQRHIVRGDGYANVIKILDTCTFNHSELAPILNPSQAWTIQDAVFEPLIDGGAGAIETDNADYAWGFRYVGNWHGDATLGGTPWVKVKVLGGTFDGNNFDATGGTGADDYAIGLLASEGVNICGNFLGSYHGIRLLDAVAGLTVHGNDFFGAGTDIVDLAANAPFARVFGNDGIADFPATQAANADTSGATLGELETEVNELKAALREYRVIAT